MIKRLKIPRDGRTQASDWPATEDSDRTSMFTPRPSLRKLVVVIDAHLLVNYRECDFNSTPAYLTTLAALLSSSLVDVYRYSDDGPPTSEAAVREVNGTRLCDGWIILKDRIPDEGLWTAFRTHDTGWSMSGVFGNAVDVAADDVSTDAYRDLSTDAARQQRYLDALAAQVASQAAHADLYVTERPYLHAATWDVARGATITTPAEAIPLLSLYLRTQGEFLVAPSFRYNKGLFFWVGTRELLPEAWRWFSACVQHAQSTQGSDLLILGGSLLQRIDRALESRDAIHTALNQIQNNDIQEEALAALDVTLLLLMGAVDVSARVANRVLDLNTPDKRVGWQSDRWLKRVRAAHPTLADVAENTRNRAVLDILRYLRNSIHGAALQGIAVLQGGEPTQSLIGLPQKDEAEILSAMDDLGGREAWGVTTVQPGRAHVDPGVLGDRLFGHVVDMLNDLMTETPVERLPGVRLSEDSCNPPISDDPSGMPGTFDPWIRESIRLQIGL